jgi:hypothetical protein
MGINLVLFKGQPLKRKRKEPPATVSSMGDCESSSECDEPTVPKSKNGKDRVNAYEIQPTQSLADYYIPLEEVCDHVCLVILCCML